MSSEDPTKLKITIIAETEEDPSSVLDAAIEVSERLGEYLSEECHCDENEVCVEELSGGGESKPTQQVTLILAVDGEHVRHNPVVRDVKKAAHEMLKAQHEIESASSYPNSFWVDVRVSGELVGQFTLKDGALHPGQFL